MQLDVHTMFVVTIAVTVILGCLLIYAWYQHRKIPALAWWGCAHMVASAGVWLVSRQGVLSDFSVDRGGERVAVRCGRNDVDRGPPVRRKPRFACRHVWWRCGLASRVADLEFHVDPVRADCFSSMMIALYTFGAAIEFWRGRDENLLSRLPLIVLLSMHGVIYFAQSRSRCSCPEARAKPSSPMRGLA